MVQTKKPTRKSSTSPSVEKDSQLDDNLPLEAQVAIMEENNEYESLEDDTVRVFNTKKELVPEVYVDMKIFRVYLTDSKETYLEFREPNTKECLELADRKKGPNMNSSSGSGQEKFLEFVSSLSCGPVDATVPLLTRLPVKFQYKIVRTIEYITEAQGTRLV